MHPFCFILLFCLISPAVGFYEQLAHVNGQILCTAIGSDDRPTVSTVSNATVELMEVDLEPVDRDDTLATTMSDLDGNFDLSGVDHEIFDIGVYLRIRHSCPPIYTPSMKGCEFETRVNLPGTITPNFDVVLGTGDPRTKLVRCDRASRPAHATRVVREAVKPAKVKCTLHFALGVAGVCQENGVCDWSGRTNEVKPECQLPNSKDKVCQTTYRHEDSQGTFCDGTYCKGKGGQNANAEECVNALRKPCSWTERKTYEGSCDLADTCVAVANIPWEDNNQNCKVQRKGPHVRLCHFTKVRTYGDKEDDRGRCFGTTCEWLSRSRVNHFECQ